MASFHGKLSSFFVVVVHNVASLLTDRQSLLHTMGRQFVDGLIILIERASNTSIFICLIYDNVCAFWRGGLANQ